MPSSDVANFGTGLARGLTTNIRQNEQDAKLKALMRGDILGLGGLPDPQEEEGSFGGILHSIGAKKSAGPSLENLIQQRTELQTQAKRRKDQQKIFQDNMKALKSGVKLDAAQRSKMIQDTTDPMSRMILTGTLKKMDETNEIEEKVRQKLLEREEQGRPLNRKQMMGLQFQLDRIGSKMKVKDFLADPEGAKSPFKKVDASKHTPKSVGDFQNSITDETPEGDRSLLRGNPQEQDIGELASALNAAIRAKSVVEIDSDEEKQVIQTINALVRKLHGSQVSPKDLQIEGAPEQEPGESEPGFLTRAWTWFLEQLSNAGAGNDSNPLAPTGGNTRQFPVTHQPQGGAGRKILIPPDQNFRRPNADGSVSSEITETVEVDGKYYLTPTIGPNKDQLVEGPFDSEEEANQAAPHRSNSINPRPSQGQRSLEDIFSGR